MIGARPAGAADVDELTALVRFATVEARTKRGGPEWEQYDRYRQVDGPLHTEKTT